MATRGHQCVNWGSHMTNVSITIITISPVELEKACSPAVIAGKTVNTIYKKYTLEYLNAVYDGLDSDSD